jgi:hypothetical protein
MNRIIDEVNCRLDKQVLVVWGRGVSVIDINNYRLIAIYVCNIIYPDSIRRINLLYITRALMRSVVDNMMLIFYAAFTL